MYISNRGHWYVMLDWHVLNSTCDEYTAKYMIPSSHIF